MAGVTSRRVAIAAGVVVALAVGFAVGRFALPARVVESERIVASERDTELRFAAYVGQSWSTVRRDLEIRTVRTWQPSGVVTETTETIDASTSAAGSVVASQAVAAREVSRAVDVQRARAVEVTRPDWYASARGGLALDDGRLVVGGEVARRIIGPVFLGAWLTAADLRRDGAAAGISLALLW